MTLTPDEYRAILESDPGNSVFADLAEIFRTRLDFSQALQVSLSGLSHNPGCHKGRLTLARTYYDMGFTPFAVRELELLIQELPDNEELRKLLIALGYATTSPDNSTDRILAEGEFEVETLEDLEK